jgi:hypothetical protein
MPYPPRSSWRLVPLAPLAALLAVVVTLAACGTSATTAHGPLTASAPTPTKALAATAAPVRCGNTLLPTPAPSGPSTYGAFVGWNGVPPLPGTLIYSDAARASDGVQTSSSSEALGLCTPGMTPDAVTAFYVTRLPANGWATIATFPPESSCIGICWKRDAGGGTTSYVALDHLQAADSATLYTLTRLDIHTN